MTRFVKLFIVFCFWVNCASPTGPTPASTPKVPKTSLESTSFGPTSTTTSGNPLELPTLTDSTVSVSSTTASREVHGGRKRYLTADDVPTCKEDSADLGECIRRIMEIVMPRFVNGSEELNIPVIDPFALNRTTYQYTNGPLSGRITMRRALVYGFAHIQHQHIDFQMKEGKVKMYMKAFVPHLRIVGSYKAELTLNNVRIRPRGNFNITLVDVNMEQSSEGELYETDGHRFVRLTKIEVEPQISDLKIEANGIFPDPTLNEIVLNVANEYWRDIYRIMLPETRQYWAPMLLRLTNEALSTIPFDNFVKN